MHRESALTLPALVLLAASAGLSCGGEAPPPRAPTAVPSTVAPPAPPPADLSEVPAPSGLVAWGRVAKPSALLSAVRDLSKLPTPQSDAVTEVITSEAVGPLVDLDQPIDFALAVTGSGGTIKDLRIVSAAVKDPDHAKAVLSERYKLVPGDNGALLVQGLGRPKRDDGDADDDGKPDPAAPAARACELAPAFGDAPVRLVCAWSPKALSELGPWITRGAPRAPTRADVQLDFRMEPLEPSIRQAKQLVAMVLGSVVADRLGMATARDLLVAVGTDAVDFATDLSGGTLDLKATDTGVEVKLALQLPGTTSAIARLATAHPERQGPAPAAFWQLPADAGSAHFARGIDEAELVRGRELVFPLVSDALADEGVKPADAKPLLDALGKLLPSAGFVYASGMDLAAVRRARDAMHAAPADDAEAKHAFVETALGWGIAEIDEPPARLSSALKGISASLAAPSIAAAYHKKHKDLVPPAVKALPVPRSAALPAGTLHYVLEVHSRHDEPKPVAADHHGKPPPPAKPLQLHLFLVPDGPRTWLAVGGEEAIVLSHLAVALGPTGDKLGGRADLAVLKEGSMGSGGFVTPASISLGSAAGTVLMGGAAHGPGLDLSRMPHQGQAAILVTTSVPPGAKPTTFELRARAPRDAIEDLVSAGVARAAGF
jgi:hypothetical protein